MKKISYYILTVVLVGCITSCSTSKKTSKMPMVGGLSGVEYVEKIITAAPDWKNFYGKASLELLLDKQQALRGQLYTRHLYSKQGSNRQLNSLFTMNTQRSIHLSTLFV